MTIVKQVSFPLDALLSDLLGRDMQLDIVGLLETDLYVRSICCTRIFLTLK